MRLTAAVELEVGPLLLDGPDRHVVIAEALDELEARLRDAGFETKGAPVFSQAQAEQVAWVGRPAGRLTSCRQCGSTIGFVRVAGRAVPVDPDGARHSSSCRSRPAAVPGVPRSA